MLETDYTFLKNSCLIFSLFIILFTGFSCTPDTLWDIPVQTVKEHLKTSQYTFIENIDFKEKKITDVRILGPGASFYFSSIFNLTGYPDYAKALLASTWKNGTKLWQDEAGFIFLTELLKEKEYKLLEAHALKYLKKIKTSINLPDVKKLYIEALYWQNKDEAVLAAIHQFFPDTGELYQKNPEITLFQAVAECRLQKKGWEQTFTEFVLQSDSSLLHSRAYQYIILNPERFSSFDMEMQQFLLAKSFLATGYLSQALPLIESFIENIDPKILQKLTIINELGRTYLSLGEHKRGLKFLNTLSKTISGRGNLDALEMAGRITRKDKKYREAALYLKPVYQQTNDPLQRDRAAWFYLDCILELSLERFLDDIVSYSRQWNDPGYFDDIIQKGISILIAKKKWKDLEIFFNSIKSKASKEITIQINYLTARFLSLGYIKNETTSSDSIKENYLREVSKEKDNNYYVFLASILLNEKPKFIQINTTNNDNDLKINTSSAVNAFIFGFFEYGLIDEGYSMLIKYSQYINSKTIFSVVKILRERGNYKKAIWLMNRIVQAKDYQPTKEALTYLYPQEYKSYIDENAKKREFYAPIFYSLIREESAFDPQNTSPAGAIGLSQLMQTTAQDIAGWLRLKDYDLLDPETNIIMGTYYYSRLLRLLKNIPKTLIAYNAGLGRLRNWEKEYNGLPTDLFIEALPYRETRNYVKKIIVTACIYSYLYYETNPSGIISLFFPEMF